MNVCIVEERSYSSTVEGSSASPDSYTAHIQRKHFLYFTNEKIFSVLMEICRTLGMSTAQDEHEENQLLFVISVHTEQYSRYLGKV